MKTRYQLKLKQITGDTHDTARIYEYTRRTVDDFNSYFADFFETIKILRENLEKPDADKEKKNEISESIKHVELKIDELSAKMNEIADEMPSLIELSGNEKL